MFDSHRTQAGQTGGVTTKTFPSSDHEAITKAARGVPDRTASTLSFVAGTRTFTITPVSGAWSYYIAGRRYVKSAAESIVISDTSGEHWIHYDGATLTDSVNPTHDELEVLIVDTVRVGLVYWNATDGAAYILGDERHGPGMPGETQDYLHDVFGSQWISGFDLSGYVLNSDADADVQFEATDGEIYDDDIRIPIVDGNPANQYEQQLNGADAEIPILYRTDVAGGAWKEDAASVLPYKHSGADRLAFNNDDGDGTWSQVEVDNNKFLFATLIATNDWQYPIKMVQGQAQYATRALALEGAQTEQIAWGADFPTPEIVVLYRFLLQTNTGFGGTKNLKIIEIIDLRQLSLTGGAVAPPAPHAMLSNTHSDAVAAAVTRGGLQVGNATPAWDLVTVGAAGTSFNSDGTDAAWTAAMARLAGRAGGQTLQGGTAGSEDLSLESTSHGTKGEIISKDHHEFVKGAAYDAVYDNGNVNGNIVIDWNNGNVQQITLTGNVTQVLFTDPPGPCNCRLWIIQDGVGGRTIADNWDPGLYWGGTAPVVSADAGNFDIGVFEYFGIGTYAGQMAQGVDGLGFNPP